MDKWLFGARSRLWKIAVAGLVVMQSVAVLVAPASASAGTVLMSDDFTTGSLTSTQYVVGGSAFTPCLTSAGTGTSVPARCSPTIDPAGDGALRLTSAVKNQAGFLLYNNPLPTKGGLDISFNMFQYGGNGADGIAFFLTNGAYSLTTSGPDGGSLGYQYNGSTLGLDHSLMGVGLDAWGNYSVEWNDPRCSIQKPQSTPYAQEVAVRGPGGADRTSGYCLLGHPVHVAGIDNLNPSTRAASERAVHIIIDPPSDTSPLVRVYLDGVLETTVPEPAVLASTPTFKFGWAASTGGSTDVHEINLLKVSTVVPITPELSVTVTPAVSLTTGGTASIVATPTVTDTAGPESQPIMLTLTAPDGTSFSGTPSGTGWVCGPPSAQTASCTYTPAGALMSGTVLPPVTAGVTTSGSGDFIVTSAVNSGDNSATGAQLMAHTAVTVKARPVAPPLAATTDLQTPVTLPLPSTPSGSGPFHYQLVTTPSAAEGVATINATSGAITFTPAADYSGTANFTYRASDADGVFSDPADVAVIVHPATNALTASTQLDSSGAASATTSPPAPGGTGPFTYALVGQPASGVATIDPTTGVISYLTTSGESGVFSAVYTVTDANSITSSPRDATITVLPYASPERGSTDAAHPIVLPTPTLAGSGPFTFTMIGQPVGTTATIDPITGAITFDPNGQSGSFDFSYVAIDAGGLSTGPVAVHVDVTPITDAVTVLPSAFNFVLPTTVATPEGAVPETVTAPAPTPSGTGPFTYQLGTPIDPLRGMATIDATTGVISFTPAPGTTGLTSIPYTVTDAHGLVSDPAIATVFVTAPSVPAVIPGVGPTDPTDPTPTDAMAPTPDATVPAGPETPTSQVPPELAFTGFDPALELIFVALLTAAGISLQSLERRRRRQS